jgi:hypothetical protein
MSDYDQTEDELIEGEHGRLVHVGHVSLTDEDVENYLEIDPETISDSDLRKLGEILFEFLQDVYADALKKAYTVLILERNDEDASV